MIRMNRRTFDHDEAARLYVDDKLSLSEVASILGTTAVSVGNALKTLGVVRRSVGQPRKFSYEKAITLYTVEKLSTCEIGKYFNVNPTTVSIALRKAGVEMRTNQKYVVNHQAFAILTPKSAYWIGFLMADGCVTGNKNGQRHISLALAEKDKDHIQKFLDFLESDYPITTFESSYSNSFKKTRASHTRIVSDPIAADLSSYGVVPRKSGKERVIDDRLLYNPHFWRGVIDGDGCITIKKTGRFQLKLIASEALANQYLDFVRSIVQTKVTARKRKYTEMWDVELSEGKAKPVLEVLYRNAPIALDRKYDKAMMLL